jgi:ABC-type uncharacterized transport system involved in gliding motility auxiliary subunit
MARRNARFLSAGAIGVVVVAFIALNLLGNALLGTARLDLTEGRVYTLSEGTKRTLSSLREPVTLRFFYSEEQANGYPVIQSYGMRLKGLLAQYARLSGGKVKLEIVNPRLFSEEEDLAVALGVAGIPVDESGNRLYFGLVASNSADGRQAIPFFDPDKAAFVEYELTRMIHDLSVAQKPKIGLLTWLPLQGGGGTMFGAEGKWVMFDQIKEAFDLHVLEKDVQAIPSDISVLMIVHPTEAISEATLYAIDQFILRGGSALVFTDPFTRVSGSTEKYASNLEKLYHAWGIDMPKEDTVADPEAAIRVQNDERGSILETISNPLWLALQKGNFNASEIVSADLGTMRFIVSGRFLPWQPKKKTANKSAMTMTPLVLSGEASAIVSSNHQLFDTDPARILTEGKPAGGRQVLAAHLGGTASTAFPERKGKEHIGRSEKPASIIVVGDADMLRDGFWVQKQNYLGKEILIPNASNGSFVLNALDYLSGGGDLIGLRSRTVSERPFEKVEALRREAEIKFRHREDELKSRLSGLEQRLSALQGSEEMKQSEDGELLLSPQQQEELEQFREEMISTRKELRGVQPALRENIEVLGFKLKWLNIGMIPLLVLGLALVVPARLGARARRSAS